MNERRCENCRFWQIQEPVAYLEGVCKRHAPIITNTHRGQWPSVKGSELCGDYEPMSSHIEVETVNRSKPEWADDSPLDQDFILAQRDRLIDLEILVDKNGSKYLFTLPVPHVNGSRVLQHIFPLVRTKGHLLYLLDRMEAEKK